MRPTKLLLPLVVGLCFFAGAIAQAAEHVYGGLYQPPPAESQPVRAWRIADRSGLPKDFPEIVKGRFLALHGASLVDECKLVLVETDDGRRRALRFHLLSPEDRQVALDAHQRAPKPPASSPTSR